MLVPLLITMHGGVVLPEESYFEQKFGVPFQGSKVCLSREV